MAQKPALFSICQKHRAERDRLRILSHKTTRFNKLNASFAQNMYQTALFGAFFMLVISTFLINSVLNFALGLLIARFLGPVDFGQYAIAAALAVVLNVLFLDWIRLSATRFYSEETREKAPDIRGTLDAIFALSSLGIALVCALAIALGHNLGLMTALAALSPAMAICNGLFDYNTALVRARFKERLYSLLVILKNTFSFTLMVAGAWWFESPVIVAAGFIVSISTSILLCRKSLIDPNVTLWKPDWSLAGQFLRYGFPVILATLIYFLIPLLNRTTIAGSLGFSASGQFSLGYDIAIRVVQTVGSALDIVLFQIALRTEGEKGLEQARQQLSSNMGIVLAMISAVSVGYWLILPSFEAVLVPEAFRGNFAEVSTILLPGLVCFVLTQAAITPVFQLKRKTWPLIVAALIALVINTILCWRLGSNAPIADYARAQSISFSVAMVVALGLALREMKVLPSLSDIAGTCFTTAVMIAAVWHLRDLPPSFALLLASIGVGGIAFAGIAFLINLVGCRDWITQLRDKK
jgi:O-antigen/teichoic acid export membrane protein